MINLSGSDKMTRKIMEIQFELNKLGVNFIYSFKAREITNYSIVFAIEGEDGFYKTYKAEESSVFLDEWLKRSLKNIKAGKLEMDNEFIYLEECSLEDSMAMVRGQDKEDFGVTFSLKNMSVFLKEIISGNKDDESSVILAPELV